MSPITGGQLRLSNSGVSLSSPFDAEPADWGYKAFTCSPIYSVATQVLTVGTIYLSRFNCPETITVNSIATVQNPTASSGTGAYVGIYDSSFNRVVSSSDLGTAWNSGTTKQNAVASTTLTGGRGVYYYVALLAIGGTGPTLYRTGAGLAAQVNIGTSIYMGATGGTGQTSLPSTVTPTALGYKLFSGLWFV